MDSAVDMIELFGFLGAAALSFVLVHIKFFRDGSICAECQALFLSIVAAVFADSYNKVDGYPASEIKGLIIASILIGLQALLILMLIKHKKLFVIAFIAGIAVIHTPILTAPVSIARQYAANRAVARHPALQCEELYFTKMDGENAFSLGKNRFGYVAIVYRRGDADVKGAEYHYDKTIWLPAEKGQHPNDSDALIRISAFALRHLRYN